LLIILVGLLLLIVFFSDPVAFFDPVFCFSSAFSTSSLLYLGVVVVRIEGQRFFVGFYSGLQLTRFCQGIALIVKKQWRFFSSGLGARFSSALSYAPAL